MLLLRPPCYRAETLRPANCSSHLPPISITVSEFAGKKSTSTLRENAAHRTTITYTSSLADRTVNHYCLHNNVSERLSAIWTYACHLIILLQVVLGHSRNEVAWRFACTFRRAKRYQRCCVVHVINIYKTRREFADYREFALVQVEFKLFVFSDEDVAH